MSSGISHCLPSPNVKFLLKPSKPAEHSKFCKLTEEGFVLFGLSSLFCQSISLSDLEINNHQKEKKILSIYLLQTMLNSPKDEAKILTLQVKFWNL